MANGRATFSSLTLPSGTVGDDAIASGAGIDADKLQHLHKLGTSFDLAIGGTVATREEIVFVATATARLRGFYATFNVGGSAGDSDFDLKVNGSSVLSAVVNFANSDADRLTKEGTINTPALSVGDIVSISVTRNSSHDGTGPFAWVEIEELAA